MWKVIKLVLKTIDKRGKHLFDFVKDLILVLSGTSVYTLKSFVAVTVIGITLGVTYI